MAISTTHLLADLPVGSNTLSVNSGTGFPTVGTVGQNYFVRIDGEIMSAYAHPVSGTVKVRRGIEGTAVAAHDILARVYVSATPGDFPAPPQGASAPLPPDINLQQTIGEDKTFTTGEVAAIVRDTTFVIQKATAALFTLVAPSVAQNGVRLTFTSATAAAHVMTATALLGDGASGSPEDTATFDAFIGASLTLVANNGIWNIVAAVAVVVT